MRVYELNIDGLVGPTHNYAGLSAGNLASIRNAQRISNPQAAARQGLAKMRVLHNMGIKQALFPPHQRPNLRLLHQLGFTGMASQQISKAHLQAPELLAACFSAASMWAANMATVSASLDCADSKVHFTAANLIHNLHRRQEVGFSRDLLQRLFHDERYFVHHPDLPASRTTSDEGAANHSRLCERHDTPGLPFFVYGTSVLQTTNWEVPQKFLSRQTLEACTANARAHQLNRDHVVYAQQNPQAIDQGVFHNDVIALANESVLLVHQQAFLHQQDVFRELQEKADFRLNIIEVSSDRLSLADAVSTYLFNSQLLSLPDGSMALIAPTECEANTRVQTFLEETLADRGNPINTIQFLDVKQSMSNGGGPACLRLRVPLNDHELNAMHQGILVTHPLLDILENWVMTHYRSELGFDDLPDLALIDESYTALDELTTILHLGSIYPFQLEGA